MERRVADNKPEYKTGISNRMLKAMLESGLDPETGRELTKEARKHYQDMLDKPKEEPKKKGWFRRLLPFKKGGSVKKYAKGGGVRKARYK